ncbi:hypothetical protein KC335_g115 [Hortaea werneckii]|nr:hypothetical protein KC335_g115 [Hortaea werneckii]
MQVSKLTLAPYWFVSDVLLCAQRGFPFVTLTTMLLPAFDTWLPELSFAGSSAEDVLGRGGRVARGGVVATCCGVYVAVTAAVLVARAILGEGGFVALRGCAKHTVPSEVTTVSIGVVESHRMTLSSRGWVAQDGGVTTPTRSMRYDGPWRVSQEVWIVRRELLLSTKMAVDYVQVSRHGQRDL